MSNDAESDVVHLKVGEHLPVMPVPSPTTEMLKQLLEQMLENERRRLRNEYVRITMLFFVILAVAIGGGIWFAHSLLDQLRAERQMADRSLQALLQHVYPEMSSPEPSGSVPTLDAQRSTLHVPATAADTNTVLAQADIKRLIADLETKKQALADMLKSHNAQTKNLLQSRDSELQVLHERMQEVQRKIMNAAPPEAQPVKEAQAPPAIEAKATDSLTVITSNAGTLRLPIPAP
jgi:cytoskeletal protein RodZ